MTGGGPVVPKSSVQYLVFPDDRSPFLLALVRWPDVAQAISPARPDWQEDPGLFDLPYDPNSVAISIERASAIADSWGASLPLDGSAPTTAHTIIRRMPANWSELAPVEVYDWSLNLVRSAHRNGTAILPEGHEAAAASVSLEKPAPWQRLAAAFNKSAPESRRSANAVNDRRRQVRVLLRGSVEIGFGTSLLPANLLDLGDGGARFFLGHGSAIFDVGRILDPFVIVQPQVLPVHDPLELSAAVEWRRDSDEGSDIGVSFPELRAAQSDRVRSLVAQGSGSES
jgi:hypothetical protein